jgi:hypothetical protein
MHNLTLDIPRFKTVQESSLFDSCTVDKFTEILGEYHDLIKSWISGAEIRCGISFTGGNKSYSDEETKTTKTISIRLPLGTNVNTQDRISITKRLGTSITNSQYQIISVDTGIGILVLTCKKVEV